MKVLMLSWEYTPHIVGGMGAHVVDLVPELIADGVEVHLVVPRLSGGAHEELLPMPDGTPATNGSTVYRVDPSGMQGDFFTNTWHDNVRVEAVCSHIIRHVGGFDLIHDHDWLSGFAAVALKQGFHLPLLSTIHATEMGRNRGQLHGEMQRSIHMAEWWLTFESWRVIACSNYMAGEVMDYFGAPRHKIDVVPNGVYTDRFDALRGRDLSAFRRAWAAPNEPIVYTIGRMVPQKGPQVLVEAAPYVVREWPGVKFVIAGGGKDYTNELRAKANSLGVGGNIIFPGRIDDDVRDGLFMVADAAVFPSIYEPFGIVALEAMAAGTPVIVSDEGGLSEVVELHETGVKVYPGDPESLAWGILHTLKNPQWSQARAQNAYRVVREQFNWGLIADKTLDVYRSIVEEAKAGDWAYKY